MGHHIKKSQQRIHTNCKYNLVHSSPTNKSTGTSGSRVHLPVIGKEDFLSPDRQVTNCHDYMGVELSENDSIKICTYDIGNSLEWNGDICDNDEISKSCPLFKPRISVEEARAEFEEFMIDDKYVYDNYRDIATLQWTLKTRTNDFFSFITYIYVWFLMLFVKTKKQKPEKFQSSNLEFLVDDIWSEDDSDRDS